MSEREKRPDSAASTANGRSFGKYRIINEDEMPRLEDERLGAKGGAAEADGGAAQKPSDDAAAQGRQVVRPDRSVRPSGVSGAGGAKREEASQERGGSRKGSCPSWLKSRVYKGKRPGGDDKSLLELQELIIRHSPVGTAVLDNRGRLRIRNESFMEAIGLDTDSQVEDIDGLAKRIEGVDVSEKFWDAVESGASVEVEEEVRVEGREKAALRMVFVPVSLPSGVSWCICYIEGVSERASRTGHMYEYQSYVARLAASTGDAIVGLDEGGKIKYWNQGAEALFGFPEDEIVGKNVLGLVPEELRREAQLVFRVVRDKGVYRNFDTYRLSKSGERVPVTMTISAVRDEDGNFIGTAATCKDLRGAKDLHEKALEAEKLNAVLQMAVSVYHQINDPLCVIAANAQLLLPQLSRESGDGAKKLRSILDATRRISTVLDDLTRLTGVEPQMASSGDEEDPAA